MKLQQAPDVARQASGSGLSSTASRTAQRAMGGRVTTRSAPKTIVRNAFCGEPKRSLPLLLREAALDGRPTCTGTISVGKGGETDFTAQRSTIAMRRLYQLATLDRVRLRAR